MSSLKLSLLPAVVYILADIPGPDNATAVQSGAAVVARIGLPGAGQAGLHTLLLLELEFIC